MTYLQGALCVAIAVSFSAPVFARSAANAPMSPPVRPNLSQGPVGSDMATYYPDRAQRENVSGKAKFTCTVTVEGRLDDCYIVSEEPPGYGFGAATLKLTPTFRMKLVTNDGAPSAGRKYTGTVIWRLPEPPPVTPQDPGSPAPSPPPAPEAPSAGR